MWDQFEKFSCSTKNGPLSARYICTPKDLPIETKEELLRLLLPVACEAFHQDASTDFSQDVYRHLFSWEGLIVVLQNDTPVAFRMWQVFPSDHGGILYLAGMCVQTAFQRIGIGESLLRYVMNMYPTNQNRYTVLRTQNPSMKKCFDTAVGGLSYPNEERLPRDILEVGMTIANQLGDRGYDQDTLISRGAYQGSLYGADLVPVNERTYTKVFDRINRNNGDAVFCIWQSPLT